MKEVDEIPQEKEPGSAAMIATLGLAGFLSGVILVSVFLYTRPIIAENKAQALRAAIFEILPGTEHYEAMELTDGTLKLVKGSSDEENVVYFGYDPEGRLTGVAIPGAEPGYQDLIHVIYGYRPEEGVITGLKVLESKETPGLGDKIIKDADFQSNFDALQVEPTIEVVKKGEKNSPNEVEAITGATISSKAIGRLLQLSVEKWKTPIDGYLKEDPKEIAPHEN
ncbi:MAG: FMN-binding protein [Bacteroidota bacterium]|nr:FMN-binding protein [Bacteroidota bacterium]MDX5404386.1 FMN-binding protein [Bacteroidota bacterium]